MHMPHLENNVCIEEFGLKNWKDFLNAYASFLEEVNGHKLYATRPPGMMVIVGPDGSIQFANPVVSEDGWKGAREGWSLKNGVWEPPQKIFSS